MEVAAARLSRASIAMNQLRATCAASDCRANSKSACAEA
jgi:hypothetical protein